MDKNHPTGPNHASPEKRRSTGALQNLAEPRGTLTAVPLVFQDTSEPAL